MKVRVRIKTADGEVIELKKSHFREKIRLDCSRKHITRTLWDAVWTYGDNRWVFYCGQWNRVTCEGNPVLPEYVMYLDDEYGREIA